VFFEALLIFLFLSMHVLAGRVYRAAVDVARCVCFCAVRGQELSGLYGVKSREFMLHAIFAF